MWAFILIVVIVALMAGFVWMSHAICRFHTLKRHLPKGKLERMLCGALVVALMLLALYLTIDFVNMVMIFLHLLVIWLVCDGMAAIVGRKKRHYYAGASAFIITVAWLAMGWYNAHHVCRTAYQIQTNKSLGVELLKIVVNIQNK